MLNSDWNIINFQNGLYYIDEFFGIFGVGGIAAFLERLRPALIVGDSEGIEWLIAFALQKKRMVVIRLRRRGIAAKTFLQFIVVVANGVARPAGALNAKVVVARRGKAALSCLALEQALRQRDARRYAVAPLLFYGYVLIFVDIVEILRREALLSIGHLYVSNENCQNYGAKSCLRNDI